MSRFGRSDDEFHLVLDSTRFAVTVGSTGPPWASEPAIKMYEAVLRKKDDVLTWRAYNSEGIVDLSDVPGDTLEEQARHYAEHKGLRFVPNIKHGSVVEG